MSKPLSDAAIINDAAKQEINKILRDTEYVGLLLHVNNLYDRIGFYLGHSGGVLEPDEVNAGRKKSPPITNFMGEELKMPEKLKAGSLNPEEYEIQQRKEKVQKLWDTLPGMNPYTVLNSYTIKEDVQILRNLAKWAGVKDFDTKPLTTEFIEDIQMGIEIKNEEKAQLAVATKGQTA